MQTFYPLADLPFRFGNTVRGNAGILEHFSALSPDEQRQVIDGSRTLPLGKERDRFLEQMAQHFPSVF